MTEINFSEEGWDNFLSGKNEQKETAHTYWSEEHHQADVYSRIENWYPDIKEYTFDSEVSFIKFPEAQQMMRFREDQKMLVLIENQEAREKLKPGQKFIDCKFDLDKMDAINEKIMNEFWTDKERQLLQDVAERIDPIIKRYTEKSGGAFIKLSTRSPKDTALDSRKTYAYLKKCIEKSTVDPNSDEAAVENMLFFTRAQHNALKVTSGMEAVDMLMRSDRVYGDLMWARLHQGEENFQMKIVVREWTKIDPEWEFRAFVWNGELTTCTIYVHFCFVPEMVPIKEKLKSMIHDFWLSIKDKIKCDTYTIDFYVRPDLSEIGIVEINEPPPIAGTGVFDWEDEEDRKLIKNGPFTFRILEEPALKFSRELHPPLRKYISDLRGIPDPEALSLMEEDYRPVCNGCGTLAISVKFYRCKICESGNLCQPCFNGQKLPVGCDHAIPNDFQRLEGENVYELEGSAIPGPEEAEKSWCVVV